MLLAILCLFMIALAVAPVVTLSMGLSLTERFEKWSSASRLVLVHSVLVISFGSFWALTAPYAREPMYGEMCVPYFIAPGGPIFLLTNVWLVTAFEGLTAHIAPISAAPIEIVVVPGVVGLLLGGLQWYCIGWAWTMFLDSRAFERMKRMLRMTCV